MFLLFTKEMRFVSNDSKDEILERIRRHAEYSKSGNWFTAMTDDYPIDSEFFQDKVIIKSRYARPSFSVVMTVLSEQPTEISVKVVPSILVIIAPLMLVMLFGVLAPLFFVVGFLVVTYAVMLIAYALHVWWARNLFELKLLRK